MVHSAPTVATFHAAGASASYRILGPALKRLIRRIDHKVVVSKDALALVRSHLGGEYEVLFNGVELDEIRSVEPWPLERPARPIVFFCGRHEERKGLRILVDAVVRSALDVDVWVGSDGPDTAELTAATADDGRFHWLGRVTDDEKFARLRASDVFCAPSLRGESFGVVLIEAMAAGTTVVASSLDGYRNVATDDVDALLVEPGDADALGDALRRVTGDEALSARLRRAGETRAEGFAMASLTDRYLEIYRSILPSSG
jgi:phosphatidylinositol alpha-mannosyltransferase